MGSDGLLRYGSRGGGLVFLKLVGFLESAGWAAFLIYFPIYLEVVGLSPLQIGVVVAAPTIIGIFSGILWSSCSDYLGRRKPFIIQSAVSSSFFIFLTSLLSSFEWLLALGALRGLLTPVLEGLTVSSLFGISDRGEMGRTFGGYAMWKSIGWAVSAMTAGALSQLFGLRSALWLSSLMFLMIAVIAVPWISEDAGESSSRRSSREPIGLKPLGVVLESLREVRVLFFLLASLPLYLAISAMMTFFPVYLKVAGASPLLVGAIFTIPVFLEAPVFSAAGRLADSAGGKRRLLILSSALYSLLFLLVGVFRDPLLLFLIYLVLDPVTWPPLFTASSALVSQIMPPERWATGQTLYRIWAWYISPVLGSLIGGWASEALGISSMFLLMSVITISSLILFTRVREA